MLPPQTPTPFDIYPSETLVINSHGYGIYLVRHQNYKYLAVMDDFGDLTMVHYNPLIY